jgi:branched-subunit amino acid transport protein
MTDWSSAQIWAVILLVGVGTFAFRLSFLGLLGGRDLPPWAMRLLRYTPVAVIPGLMAPLVLFPQATGGQIDPLRLAVAAVTLLVGWGSGSILWAIAAGVAALTGLTLLAG